MVISVPKDLVRSFILLGVKMAFGNCWWLIWGIKSHKGMAK